MFSKSQIHTFAYDLLDFHFLIYIVSNKTLTAILYLTRQFEPNQVIKTLYICFKS